MVWGYPVLRHTRIYKKHGLKSVNPFPQTLIRWCLGVWNNINFGRMTKAVSEIHTIADVGPRVYNMMI